MRNIASAYIYYMNALPKESKEKQLARRRFSLSIFTNTGKYENQYDTH